MIRSERSAIGMNSAGEIQPSTGWSQRSRASAPVSVRLREVDLRLVEQLQLIALERAAQLALDELAAQRSPVHALLEELVAVAAALLDLVERQVGVADQVARVLPGPARRARCRYWRRRSRDGR